MDITDSTKKQIEDMLEELTLVAACESEQPTVVEWAQKKRALQRIVIFTREFVLPDVPEPQPGYVSGNGLRQATYTPRPADLEVKPDESEAKLVSEFEATNEFLAKRPSR